MAHLLSEDKLPAKITQWKGLIEKYFLAEEVLNALNVIKEESGGDPGAIGDAKPIRGLLAPSYGLFQIRALEGRWTKEGYHSHQEFIDALIDPEQNIRITSNIVKRHGWKSWSGARKIGLL